MYIIVIHLLLIYIFFSLELYSKHSPIVESAHSPVAIVHSSQGSSCSEESGAASGGISEEPTTPPPQETENPSQKVMKSVHFKFLVIFFFLDETM